MNKPTELEQFQDTDNEDDAFDLMYALNDLFETDDTKVLDALEQHFPLAWSVISKVIDGIFNAPEKPQA